MEIDKTSSEAFCFTTVMFSMINELLSWMNFKEQKNFHIPIYLLKNTVFSQKNCFYRKITNLSTFVKTSSIEAKNSSLSLI